MSLNDVVLLLGSNLNSPEKNIENALELIRLKIGNIVENSAKIFTDPVEFESANKFCNTAVVVETPLSPIHLLDSIKSIEHEMGRKEDSIATHGYADRIIDIDIVLFGGIKFISDRLCIPHQKHLQQRAFSATLLKQLHFVENLNLNVVKQ